MNSERYYNEKGKYANDVANYSDYLRVRLMLLLCKSNGEEEFLNSTKDLMTMNMKKDTNGTFDYNAYYAGMKISVEANVNTWFKNDAFGSNGKFVFDKFSYKKRYN